MKRKQEHQLLAKLVSYSKRYMLNDTVIDIPTSEPHHSTGYQEWVKQIKQFSAAAQIAIEAQHKPKKRKMGPWLAVRTLQRMEDTDLP